MAEKHSFVVYYDWESLFDSLDTNEEAGQLIKALFAFAKRGEEKEFTGALKMAFAYMSKQIAKDREKWDETCEKNAENIRKRWKKSNTSVYERIQSNTNYTDKDKDRDKDIDKDNKEKSKKEKAPTGLDVIISEYTDSIELTSAIKDYAKFRKAIKAPLTDRAMKICLNKLDTLADTDERKIKVVEQSIERGWKGLFPLKEEPKEEEKSDFSKYDFVINNF